MPDPYRIRELTHSLAHRGPDREGVYQSAVVSLGAVRLSIIDVAGGDQPITSDDGDTTIVFNGEIYNFAELREDLCRRGHRFHSRSDTEVVLHAFLEWDTECFSRLRGMFAAALWSESRRRLVLVRDRLGIKPLYIHRRGPDLYFGSELKAILGNPEVERNLDLAGLNHYLSLNYVPGPNTLIQGIHKLPPGHWLEWRDGEVSSSPLLAARDAATDTLDPGFGQGGARLAAAGIGSRAPHFGRAAGNLGQRRVGFLDHPALRRRGEFFAPEDVFGLLRRAQFR